MTRRLLYHFFWNFYDYLGSYLLWGAAFALSFLAVLWAGTSLINLALPALLKVAGLGVVGLVCAGILVSACAGLFAFAARAAQEQPARFIHLKQGIRELFGRYLKLLLILGVLAAVTVGNIVFYQRMAAAHPAPVLRSAFFVASMLFVWIAVGIFLYALPLLAVVARFPQEHSVRKLLRKGFLYFALAPGFWFLCWILAMLLSLGAAASVVGVLFVVPLVAALSTSALEIVVQYAEFLGQAKQELGEGQPVSRYRRRALQLGWEWEEAQPRRGLRDLIKPWEM